MTDSSIIVRPIANAGVVGTASQQLLGSHPLMDAARALIRKVAPSDASILITGESGTGKEVVARLLHAQSKRARGPFVAVNCGAIPGDILESEMFGHARGSFTGAIAARAGLFQTAHHGTIFLDEVAEMPPALQVKLLRVIQEREVHPVGSERSIKVDVRIIAATNKVLELEVAAGRFREDLFYRLNVIPIALPPLRAWSSGIPGLVAHVLKAQNHRHHDGGVRISDAAMLRFEAYDWPGNVRELENVVERMVIMSEDGVVRPADLPGSLLALISPRRVPELNFGDCGVDLTAVVKGYEDGLIDQAMGRSGGNKGAAARLLGVNRTTLVAKLARRPADFVPGAAVAWASTERSQREVVGQAGA